MCVQFYSFGASVRLKGEGAEKLIHAFFALKISARVLQIFSEPATFFGRFFIFENVSHLFFRIFFF